MVYNKGTNAEAISAAKKLTFREAKQMKKILSILMLVTMLFSFASASDEGIAIDPTLLNAMDFSSAEWYSSYTYQTAFAVIAAAELTDITPQSIYESSKEGILNDAIYVSMDESNILYAYYFGDTACVCVLYSPEGGIAQVMNLDGITPDLATALLAEVGNPYVQIKQSDFITLLSALAGD